MAGCCQSVADFPHLPLVDSGREKNAGSNRTVYWGARSEHRGCCIDGPAHARPCRSGRKKGDLTQSRTVPSGVLAASGTSVAARASSPENEVRSQWRRSCQATRATRAGVAGRRRDERKIERAVSKRGRRQFDGDARTAIAGVLYTFL